MTNEELDAIAARPRSFINNIDPLPAISSKELEAILAQAKFAVLAKAAWDVMKRRGVDWIDLVPMDDGIAVDIADHGWMPGRFTDPYEAWVEADKWFKENISSKEGGK